MMFRLCCAAMHFPTVSWRMEWQVVFLSARFVTHLVYKTKSNFLQEKALVSKKSTVQVEPFICKVKHTCMQETQRIASFYAMFHVCKSKLHPLKCMQYSTLHSCLQVNTCLKARYFSRHTRKNCCD
jgi:hypothetical protein